MGTGGSEDARTAGVDTNVDAARWARAPRYFRRYIMVVSSFDGSSDQSP